MQQHGMVNVRTGGPREISIHNGGGISYYAGLVGTLVSVLRAVQYCNSNCGGEHTEREGMRNL